MVHFPLAITRAQLPCLSLTESRYGRLCHLGIIVATETHVVPKVLVHDYHHSQCAHRMGLTAAIDNGGPRAFCSSRDAASIILQGPGQRRVEI
jgi:hypothetical protein